MKNLALVFGLLLFLFVIACKGGAGPNNTGNPWQPPAPPGPDTTAPAIGPNGIVPDNATPASGETVAFSVSATDAGGGLVYVWDDGNAAAGTFSGSGASVTWTTNVPGPYVITVTVRDAANNESTATFNITVGGGGTPPPTNNPPTFEGELSGDVSAPVATQQVVLKAGSASDSDGDEITYTWTATGGTFSEEVMGENGPEACWEVDAPGTYTVTLTAGDGNGGAAELSKDVTVNALPTDFTVVGYEFCGNCHTDTVTDWQTTAHSSALETSVNTNPHGYRNEACFTCHAAGYPPVGDGGFISQDVTPQFANIQCESCHGTGNPPGMGSGHKPQPWDSALGYERNPDGTLVVDTGSSRVDFAGYTEDEVYDGAAGYGCGLCHEGNRHGAFEEWAISGHAIQEKAAQVEDGEVGPPGEANCVKCHNGQYFVSIQIDGGDPPAENLLPEDMNPGMRIGCATCHDPHNNQYESQLRADSTSTVTIPFADTVVSGGKANICLMCHNGRRTENDRNNTFIGASSRGMHGNAQGSFLFGLAAWEYPGFTYDEDHPHNTWNENKCVTCHMYSHDYVDSTDPRDWGHDWKAEPEPCLACHSNMDKDEMWAFKTESQEEIVQLLTDFETAWPDAWKTADTENPGRFNLVMRDTDPATGVGPARDDPTLGDLYRQAWWNYSYIKSDGSEGVHNPRLAKQMLESAIQAVNELNAG